LKLADNLLATHFTQNKRGGRKVSEQKDRMTDCVSGPPRGWGTQRTGQAEQRGTFTFSILSMRAMP